MTSMKKTAQSWVSKLKVHSWLTLASPLRYAGVGKHVPSAYLLCDADQAIPIQAQEGMVAASGNG